MIKRVFAKPEDFVRRPPVIANSFPKSGTNLLIQILGALPNLSNSGSVIASMPTLTYKERNRQAHLCLIERIIPDELVFAHLFYDASYQAALADRHCIHFFIFRDLRDVAISEAYYLTYMNRWHRMHPYFKSLSNTEERISTAILGVSKPHFPYDYPDIGQRFARYQGWLKQSDVFAVKFEDLASENRDGTLRRIATFFAERRVVKLDIDEMAECIAANIDPVKSHTFREGKAGGWRNVFTEKHKAEMKAVAGELLIQLGYEKDLNW